MIEIKFSRAKALGWIMFFVLLLFLVVHDWVHPPAHPKFYYVNSFRTYSVPTSIYVGMDKYVLAPLFGLGIFLYMNLLIDPVILRANFNGFERSGSIWTQYYSWEDVEYVTYEHLYRMNAVVFKIKPGREKRKRFGLFLITRELIPISVTSSKPEGTLKQLLSLPKVHQKFKRPTRLETLA